MREEVIYQVSILIIGLLKNIQTETTVVIIPAQLLCISGGFHFLEKSLKLKFNDSSLLLNSLLNIGIFNIVTFNTLLYFFDYLPYTFFEVVLWDELAEHLRDPTNYLKFKEIVWKDYFYYNAMEIIGKSLLTFCKHVIIRLCLG